MVQTIDKILSARGGTDAVLATLVEIAGSGFRRPGARMLIFADGDHIGGISGGCLEKDVVRTCFGMTETGPQKVLYDTRSNELHPAGAYGTGCEGMVYLLLERLPERGNEALKKIALARDDRIPVVLAIAHQGEELGTIATLSNEFSSGSRLKKLLHRSMAEALADSKSHHLHINNSDGSVEKILIEYVAPRTRLIIIGAGDDAIALSDHAYHLGWDPVVCSPDPLKLTKTRRSVVLSPGADLQIDEQTAVVFISHDFELDKRFLPDVLTSPAFYVGLLGPRKRTARLFSELVSEGKTADLDRVHAPVGLDLGSDEPSGVALSIAAEILAVQNARTAGMLSVEKPAHIQTRLETRIVDSFAETVP